MTRKHIRFFEKKNKKALKQSKLKNNGIET